MLSRPNCYLAGGLSEWRERVRTELDVNVHDPFVDSDQTSIYQFVRDDLVAINASDFVLAVVDYHRHTGTALELGYAHARGIPIYLVWELDTPPDSMMVGVAKKVFMDLDDAMSHIERRVLNE